MSSTDISSYVTVMQAAKILSVSMQRVRKQLKDGAYDHALKIGRMWLIPTHQVIKKDRRLKTKKENQNEN